MGWSDYSFARYLDELYEKNGPRVLSDAEKEALSAKGWIPEAISQNRFGEWYRHKDGRVAWSKQEEPSRIVCELIGSLLAQSAKIPAPTVDSITYNVDGKDSYACLSPAMGKTFKTFYAFTDTTVRLTVE